MNVLQRILETIAAFIIESVLFLKRIFITVFERIWSKFLDISIPEKIIFLNTIPALFAIVLPVARFYIFERYFNINNPLAVYMIGIVIIMFASLYIRSTIIFPVRLVLNGYYLFWVIYIPLAGELTKAQPHEIYAGYYLNIIVPAVYILASVFSFILRV